MVRWIVFDDDTAEAVVSRFRRGAAEIQNNTPIDAALQNSGPSVIVLPSSTPGKLLIARFSTQKQAEMPIVPPVPPSVLAAPAFHKKPTTSEKKTWWKRIVA